MESSHTGDLSFDHFTQESINAIYLKYENKNAPLHWSILQGRYYYNLHKIHRNNKQ